MDCLHGRLGTTVPTGTSIFRGQPNGDFGGEQNKGKAAAGVGGATDKVEVFEQGRADRGSKERWNHSVGGPAVERSADHSIASLEIGWGEPFFVNDPSGKAGQELFVQDPDDPVGISG